MSIPTTKDKKIYRQLRDKDIIWKEPAFVKIIEQKYINFKFPLPLIN